MLTIILEDMPGLGIGQYHIIEAAQLRNAAARRSASAGAAIAIRCNIAHAHEVRLGQYVPPATVHLDALKHLVKLRARKISGQVYLKT
ncbi:hypothetical protein [uncultured Duncaniella sp.]|uniref:hypothetical protein n=1 Tax=uncultured Duncaniella sp. TaxID=2768039 RepID=UPI0025A636B1|nr:hypothetical protein [uncultured Duncaniella sp.]